MRVLVIGDVSWRGKYHLGDEAMTEVAMKELRRRGIDVTLVAGDPEVSALMYGVPTVPRLGFATVGRRKDKQDRLEQILKAFSQGDVFTDIEETLTAVRESDAILIAGGGNLNSIGVHHIYERVLLKRLAEIRGIPLYVSSQTVGPHLLPHDAELIREIVDYARVFGARERGTFELVRALLGNNGSVVHTFDDAILLDPSMTVEEAKVKHGLPERFVVGSFTYHAGSSDNDFEEQFAREEYYRSVAKVLDQIVTHRDIDIVLLPHMGRMVPDDSYARDSDAYGHERIIAFSESQRIRALPLMQARELLSITAGAEFSVSTRYHPVIFGSAVAVPAIGFITSYYSASRVRGALSNIGMGSFAVPLKAWSPLLGERLLDAISSEQRALLSHIHKVREQQLEYQRNWWDGIVSDLKGTGVPLTSDLEIPPPFDWRDDRDRELFDIMQVMTESVDLHRWNQSLKTQETNRGLRRLERTLDQLRRETDSELSTLRDELASLRHRLRPPGANFRDKVRHKLRELRKR